MIIRRKMITQIHGELQTFDDSFCQITLNFDEINKSNKKWNGISRSILRWDEKQSNFYWVHEKLYCPTKCQFTITHAYRLNLIVLQDLKLCNVIIWHSTNFQLERWRFATFTSTKWKSVEKMFAGAVFCSHVTRYRSCSINLRQIIHVLNRN